jgi:ATP-dependent Lon protease
VGGIKEKILAAIRSGVEEVLVPARNEKDLEEIPPEILQSVKIRFVSSIDDVMRLIFGDLGPPPLRRPEAEVLHATVPPPDSHLHRGGPPPL